MKAKTEKKILIASWQVCVFDFDRNPFRVVKLGTARRVCIRCEGELAQCKWHFTTRQKAQDFARKMNKAARCAIVERQDEKTLSSSKKEHKIDENEFSFSGKTYVASESDKNNTCRGCAFCAEECTELKRRGKIPCCSTVFRADRQSVIFVEKGTQK